MSSPVVCQSDPWHWADVGFDTTKKLWFVTLPNNKGTVQTYLARNIILKNGYGAQYHWPDGRGQRDFWHVRERIFANDVKSINCDDEKGEPGRRLCLELRH